MCFCWYPTPIPLEYQVGWPFYKTICFCVLFVMIFGKFMVLLGRYEKSLDPLAEGKLNGDPWSIGRKWVDQKLTYGKPWSKIHSKFNISKNDGWKMIHFLLKMVPFQGTFVHFRGGSTILEYHQSVIESHKFGGPSLSAAHLWSPPSNGVSDHLVILCLSTIYSVAIGNPKWWFGMSITQFNLLWFLDTLAIHIKFQESSCRIIPVSKWLKPAFMRHLGHLEEEQSCLRDLSTIVFYRLSQLGWSSK